MKPGMGDQFQCRIAAACKDAPDTAVAQVVVGVCGPGQLPQRGASVQQSFPKWLASYLVAEAAAAAAVAEHEGAEEVLASLAGDAAKR